MRPFTEHVLGFLKRNERPLATVLFVSGFVTDLLTFGLLDLSSVTLLFAGYLAIVVIAIAVGHVAYEHRQSRVGGALSVLMPLLAQFTFGSLLSGFIIFYTKSAVLSVSWPFLLLLALVFFGNEVFRNHREQLIFQLLLLFFSLYAFAVFAFPLFTGQLGTQQFLLSTACTILVFSAYVLFLRGVGKSRLRQVYVPLFVRIAVITALLVGAYMAGLLPPIPLTLKSGGIYQSVVRTDAGYAVTGEQARAWYDPRPQVVHHVGGTPLYAFSSVFAPGKFSTSIVHVWQRHDEEQGGWVTRSTVAFPLSGGREGGYRGYSLSSDPQPGKWRVLVQTLSGQTIGKFSFNVVNVSTMPPLTSSEF